MVFYCLFFVYAAQINYFKYTVYIGYNHYKYE